MHKQMSMNDFIYKTYGQQYDGSANCVKIGSFV